MDREQIIQKFLHDNGYKTFQRIKIPGDASFRRYERLEGGAGESLILMDAPPEKEDIKPFLKVTDILHKMNLSAPEIYSVDIINGLIVLEDFGTGRFADIFTEKPSLQSKLYRQAIDALAAIRQRGGSEFDLPPYSIDVLLRESNLFMEWYLPLFTKIDAEQAYDLKNHFQQLLSDALLKLDSDKKVLVLRDYHSENLMHLPAREEEKRVGLIDYQDALVGSPVYDIVSLLDDARRDVPHDIKQEMLNYYFDLFPKIDHEKFYEDYAILAAQRNLKILGIFSRLKMRDGKDNYLKYIPRVRNYLLDNLNHPTLKGLKEFLKEQCEL